MDELFEMPWEIAVALHLLLSLVKKLPVIQVLKHHIMNELLQITSGTGYIHLVNMLLDKGAQVEIKDKYGCTPLFMAAAFGQNDIVCRLVSAGADVNTKNNFGISAFAKASAEGHIDVVKMLIKSGSQIEIRNQYGRTPLWSAAANGQADVVRALVSAKADVNTQNNISISALSIASQEGYIDVVNILIDNGAQIETRDKNGYTPLAYAAAKGQSYVVRVLMSAVAEKRGVNQSALMAAAFTGCSDIVNTLLKYGMNMYEKNIDNMQPTDVASYCGHTDIAEFLLVSNRSAASLRHSDLDPPSGFCVDCKNGADIEAENVHGLRPIHCAVRIGCVELVKLLIQHGANVDADDAFGNRPLHEAVCHGLNVVQLLVQSGAQLNVQNIDGKTPLHIAVEHQQADVVVFLLSQDTDVGLTDVWHNTPFHYVTSELLAESGVAESVENVLTEKSRLCFIWNTVNVSVLQHIRMCKISDNQCHKVQAYTSNNLVKPSTLCKEHKTQTHNVNVFVHEKLIADCLGNTPLHQAVGVYGHIKMFKVSRNVTKTVEFLLKRGADINAQNNDGLTPLHVARGEKAIEACLRHADKQSFAITDKRGRNFWHLLFLTRTQNEVELGTSIRPMIAKPDIAKYKVDDLNRTPLHYACMDRNPWIAKWNWLAKEFIKNYSDKHVNKQDRFGRTALHYAAMGGKTGLRNILKAKKADSTLRDNYQQTSGEYSNIRSWFQLNVSLRMTTPSSFIATHRHDISACVQGCFADSSTVKECKDKMYVTVQNLTGVSQTDLCDKPSYVLNTWRECRYDYRDVTSRNPVTPVTSQQSDVQRLHKEHFVANIGGSGIKPNHMFVAIQTNVNSAMKELAKAITHLDHRFACEVYPVGSAYEETKIGCCDEFDYNFVLTKLSSICKVSYSPESPPGFVRLEASRQVHDEDMDNLFDNSGILNTRIIKFKFEFLQKKYWHRPVFVTLLTSSILIQFQRTILALSMEM